MRDASHRRRLIRAPLHGTEIKTRIMYTFTPIGTEILRGREKSGNGGRGGALGRGPGGRGACKGGGGQTSSSGSRPEWLEQLAVTQKLPMPDKNHRTMGVLQRGLAPCPSLLVLPCIDAIFSSLQPFISYRSSAIIHFHVSSLTLSASPGSLFSCPFSARHSLTLCPGL